jgi:uncharacterized protein (UPF0332 family)
VTPQAVRFLDKAQQLLDQAETMLRVGLNEAAGRTAYLAGYHAAQAFIFERTRKAPKSHSCVQTEFLRLTKDDRRIDRELRGFLSRTYNLKAIADYETDPGSAISAELASVAVESGKRFVDHLAGLVASVSSPDGDSDP